MTASDSEPQKKPAKTHANENGLRRLLKSYMRLLHGYGDPDTVKATSVINGQWNAKDDAALQNAMRYAGMDEALAGKPSETMLARIMQAHDHVFSPAQDQSLTSGTRRQAYSNMLHKIAEHAEPGISKLSPAMQKHLHTLHPLMRAPAAAAIQELAEKNIHFRIVESYRDPSLQNAHVRKGNSYAPNGYSLHSHGFALDLVPHDAKGNLLWKNTHPEWKTMMEVMQKHGFRSLGAEFNWDYPHFEMPINSREAMQYQQTKDGWRMLPPDRIPPAMREYYETELRDFARAEKLISQTELSLPMATDHTRVIAIPKLANVIRK